MASCRAALLRRQVAFAVATAGVLVWLGGDLRRQHHRVRDAATSRYSTSRHSLSKEGAERAAFMSKIAVSAG